MFRLVAAGIVRVGTVVFAVPGKITMLSECDAVFYCNLISYRVGLVI